jgi:hypothetical protein
MPVLFADYRDVVAETLADLGKRFGAMTAEDFSVECQKAFHEIGKTEPGRFVRFYLAQNALLNRTMALRAVKEQREAGSEAASLYASYLNLLKLFTPQGDRVEQKE